MKNLWLYFWKGYIPKWEIIEQYNIIRRHSGGVCGRVYILQDKVSGNIKSKQINAGMEF